MSQSNSNKQSIELTQDAINRYPYWRNRIMFSILTGYAVFYFIRKNLSVANPYIREEFDIGKDEFGAALAFASIAYGLSKFVSGLLVDNYSARYVMSAGLLLSAGVSFLLGFTTESMSSFLGLSVTTFFALFWILNNIFQGMGQPPCSRLITHWFTTSEIGKQWGIWNMSHHIGAAFILTAGGYLIVYFETWRSVFFAPAMFAVIYGVFLFNRLRDKPEDVDLPPVEVYQRKQLKEHGPDEDDLFLDDDVIEDVNKKESAIQLFKDHILFNKLIWLVSLVNLFVYIVRIGILDWAPSFLKESRGFSITESAITTSVFEIAGIVGAIAAGWLSDTYFRGRRGRVSVLFMFLLVLSVLAILYVPFDDPVLMSFTLFAVGFFVHGPMLLVAVAAADFATKKAAATAVGLTGLFGYIGAFAANFGTGYIAEHWGWDYVIHFYLASAFIGMILLLFTWNSRSPILDKLHR
ncbi:MFS transporter [Aliikangiella marina]|uniref:MFS transporter n=1 Tax=Aliikangiella marina TaxID=1712262 RepID=A0A545THV5_9GAMM|nr:MFS transporter [Aliikangiella marina]TQV76741.1 MFS transporter [Aliikangiella marina]